MLIPLDGSEIGEAALHYIEDIFSSFQISGSAEITLMHILDQTHQIRLHGGYVDSIEKPFTEEEMEQIKQDALAYLEKAADRLRSKRVNVNCKVVIRETDTSSAEEIIKAEEELNIDLFAMSTHGRRGISRWAFGSVTEKVLRGGNVPVLVVRAKE